MDLQAAFFNEAMKAVMEEMLKQTWAWFNSKVFGHAIVGVSRLVCCT